MHTDFSLSPTGLVPLLVFLAGAAYMNVTQANIVFICVALAVISYAEALRVAVHILHALSLIFLYGSGLINAVAGGHAGFIFFPKKISMEQHMLYKYEYCVYLVQTAYKFSSGGMREKTFAQYFRIISFDTEHSLNAIALNSL